MAAAAVTKALPYVMPVLAPLIVDGLRALFSKVTGKGGEIIAGGFIGPTEIKDYKRSELNPFVNKIIESAITNMIGNGVKINRAMIPGIKRIIRNMIWNHIPLPVGGGGILNLPMGGKVMKKKTK